jgi:hypothetical protein
MNDGFGRTTGSGASVPRSGIGAESPFHVTYPSRSTAAWRRSGSTPNHAPAFINRGNALAATTAIKLDPNFARALRSRGLAYSRNREYGRAVRELGACARDRAFAAMNASWLRLGPPTSETSRTVFIITNLVRAAERVVAFYNQRGTA